MSCHRNNTNEEEKKPRASPMLLLDSGASNEQKWNNMYDRLVAYKEKYGHCNIPFRFADDPKLGWWVQTQRQQWRKQTKKASFTESLQPGRLNYEKIEKLNSVGFVWEVRQTESWDEMYERFLKAQKAQQKEIAAGVSAKFYKIDSKLARWLSHQRTKYSKGLLSEERIKKLEKSGLGDFKWSNVKKDLNDNQWNRMYDQLVAYHNQYERGPLFHDGTGTNSSRSSPVARAAAAAAATTTTPVEPSETTKGPPYNCKLYPKLSNWVNTQRTLFNKGSLSKIRVEKLKSINFIFNLKPQAKYSWFDMYDRLVVYKQKHGNCLVPRRYDNEREEKDKQNVSDDNESDSNDTVDDNDNQQTLGEWVCKQRVYRKNGTLSSERQQLLDDLGFIWSAQKEISNIQWNCMFNRLLSYKEIHGDTLVPKRYRGQPIEDDDDKKQGTLEEEGELQREQGQQDISNKHHLGRWVYEQRMFKRKGTLSRDRQKLLDEIDFVWDAASFRQPAAAAAAAAAATVPTTRTTAPQHQQPQTVYSGSDVMVGDEQQPRQNIANNTILFASLAADAYNRYTTTRTLPETSELLPAIVPEGAVSATNTSTTRPPERPPSSSSKEEDDDDDSEPSAQSLSVNVNAPTAISRNVDASKGGGTAENNDDGINSDGTLTSRDEDDYSSRAVSGSVIPEPTRSSSIEHGMKSKEDKTT